MRNCAIFWTVPVAWPSTTNSTTRTAPSRRHVCHRVKYLPRFQQLLYKERRLKHRFTLLTVVQLTDALLVQQLLAAGLMKVRELKSVTDRSEIGV